MSADQEKQLREIIQRLRANEISENYAFSRIVAITTPTKEARGRLGVETRIGWLRRVMTSRNGNDTFTLSRESSRDET